MSDQQEGFSTALGVLIVLVIAGFGIAGWRVSQQKAKNNATETKQTEPVQNNETAGFMTPKKGAHYESSTPSHASTLAAVPVYVVVDFNFDLADNSTIQINRDGKDYGVGDAKVDSNKLTIRRQMDKNAPDGIYTVNYKGCWPDKSCHDGNFQFAVNKGLLSSYEDMRSKKDLTIKMSDIKFKPMNIRVSSGTKVTWINDDSVEHYVNTDSHPAHTQVVGLNSRSLKQGESYSYAFTDTGAYPYHCSAHAENMLGNIVVE